MLWFIPIVILFFLYFVTGNIKRRALKYLVIMMVGWLFTLIALLLAYVSESGNPLFSYLIFFPLTKIPVFNRNATAATGYLLLLLNLSTSVVVFSSFYYSNVYSLNHPRARHITNIVIVVPLVQFILYFPAVYRIQIENNHAAFLNAICLILNLLLLLVSILVLVWYTVCCNVRIIRPVNICITLSFTCLELLYSIILLFLVYPLYDFYIGNAERHIVIRSDLPAILLFLCTISVIIVIIVFFRYSPLESIRNHHIKIFKPVNNFNNSFSVISHSLKNQLVCIDEKVLQLSYVVRDRQKVLSGVDEIRKEINDMFENISLLNSRLKMESFIMELISLCDLCREVLDHDRIIPVTVILSKRIPQEDVECFADRACLRDCLHNLLSNAVEALPEENGVISFQLEAEGNWAVITIKDNGCGIPPEDVDQIFEPFYTTKAGQKNWGIGLSICRNIVKAHDGKLYVENTSSAGTEFKLLLPTLY